MPHREGIREYLKDVQVHGLVIDWGCGTKPIKNYLKPNDAKFIGIDKRDDVGADLVVDFEERFSTEPANYAFCLEVIEHCWNAQQVLDNIFNNLLIEGVLYLSVPFLYKAHKEDDYHRFTYHGLHKLLNDSLFSVKDIHPTVGDLNHAEGYIVKAVK